MFKKLMFILAILLLLVGVTVFYGYQKLDEFVHQPIHAQPDQLLVIEKGTSSQRLAALLQEQGIVTDTRWLPYLLKFQPELARFKAGVYALNGIDTLKELLQHFNSGKEVQLKVQFIEGKTYKQWLSTLANTPYLQHTLSEKSEADIAQYLSIPTPTLEGWFAPDTYHYVPYSSDLDILKRAYAKMQQALNMAWQNRAENLPLNSPYEMLILASIVEKETGVDNERPQVASVFINRLRLKMKLQTDPTVIYGMGERYQGNIRKADLLAATPYNTYVIAGLPPTPIAMPSIASLNAVSQPADTPYLYFVADGSGGHKFSRTLAEHQQAVNNYLRWYRTNKQYKADKK